MIKQHKAKRTSAGSTSHLKLRVSLHCFPFPVMTRKVLVSTLPVSETAALEEQVAAGHRANLTRLLKPDGRRKNNKLHPVRKETHR